MTVCSPLSPGFLHSVPAPPGHSVVVVCHRLELVCLFPPDGFSACYVVPNMLTQCLSQL